MVQVLGAPQQRESFGSMMGKNLATGFNQGLSQGMQNLAKKAQDEQKFTNDEKLERLKSGLRKEEKVGDYAHSEKLAEMKGQFAKEAKQDEFAKTLLKDQQKIQDELIPLQGAMSSVQKMRQLRSKGNLGRGSGFFGSLGGETATDRGEYEQLGKSLISYATTIPIRNRIEFETLADKLIDPSLPDAEAEGVLNAMEKIVRDAAMPLLSRIQGSEQPSMQQPTNEKVKERPPLTSFHR